MSNIVERLRAWSPLILSGFPVPAAAMAMDDAAAEIERLRARVGALEETLGLLVDHQNGCPLPSYEVEWGRAMAMARDLLEAKP